MRNSDMTTTAWLLVALVGGAGCGSSGVGDLLPDIPDPPAWDATYSSSGTWDLSGPFSSGRTVGDAAAEIVIGQIVSLAGVPSLLEDKANKTLSDAFADDIAATVDANAPVELAPGSRLMQVLGTTLASVGIDSEITLEDGLLPLSVSGDENITQITYEHEATQYVIVPADLLPPSLVTIGARWKGSVDTSSQLEIDPHEVGIRYGELVRHVVTTVTDAAQLTTLQNQVAAAFDCGNIVSLILNGQTEITIDLVEWSYTMSATELDSACASGRSAAGDRVLGLFTVDSKVEVGGIVLLNDTNGDDVSERIENGAGFGGTLNVVPKAIAPRVQVVFAAERQ